MNALTDTDVSDEYIWLSRQFFDGIPKRLDRINQFIQEIRQVDLEERYNSLESLHYEVHKLTGASGSYGYSDIESLARSLEETILQNLKYSQQSIISTEQVNSYVEYITLINKVYTQLKNSNN